MTGDYLPPADQFAEVVMRLAAHLKKKPKTIANSMYSLAREETASALVVARDATIMRDTARQGLRDIIREVNTYPETVVTARIREIAERALGE